MPIHTDLKTAKKELNAVLGKARSKPLNFAFLMAKDGSLLETDPRKSPAALWAAARKSAGAGKGVFGIMSFESGKLILRCEEEPPGPLSKGFKTFLTEHGQTIKFAFAGPSDGIADKDQEPIKEAAADETEVEETAPEEIEDPDALDPEELEDDEPVSGMDIGEVIRKARKKPLNAAWLVAKKNMILRAHPRLPIDVMRRKAKADGGGPKGALGVIMVKGKVITMTCEIAPPRSFAKAARMWLKGQGVAMKIVIALPDGSSMESDPEEDTATSQPKTPEAQVISEVKTMTKDLIARKDVLTEVEEAKFARILAAIAFLAENGEVGKAREGMERAKALLDRKLTPEARVAKARADLAAIGSRLPEKLRASLEALLDRAAASDPDSAAKIIGLFYQKLNAAKAALRDAPDPKPEMKASTPGEPLPDPVAPMIEGVSSERRKAMESWLATYGEYDNYWQAGDDEGGEYLSAALLGKDKILGALSEKEKLYLSLKAAELWRKKGTSEHIQEAADGVGSDATARRALALAFASKSGNDQRFFDTGGSYLSDPDNVAAQSDMFMRALDLDGAAVLEAFKGAEVSLALRASGFISEADRKKIPEEYWPKPFDLNKRTGLVNALADGALDKSETDRVGTTFFMAATEDDLEDAEYRKAMAKLLGQLAAGNDAEAAAERLEKAMAVPGVREMLTAKSVAPEMRNWALVQVAQNPDMTPEKLAEGWESEVISQAMAAPILDKYKGRGTAPYEVVTKAGQDGALRNSIGQAMGLPMAALSDETEAQALARQEAGMDHDYYKGNQRIDDITKLIRAETGGKPAKMTVIPVVVTSPDIGVFNINVFRLDMGEGKAARFVDDFAHRFDNFEHWRTDNKLPPGKMTYPAKLDGSKAVDLDLAGKLVTENTPVKVDTFLEWVGFVGDGVALLAGIGVGVAVIVGSGGTATPFVVGAAAGMWTAGRAGKRIYDDSERGVDVTDLSNPENRANWLEAGAGVLSIAAMGAPKLLATGAKGAQMSTGAARTTAALQMAANTADAAAMGDQAFMMATNWEKMSDGEKAMGLLNFAFWGGMAAASTKSGGAMLRDGMNFKKLSNQLEFGSPFAVKQHPDLQPGQIRVAYDSTNVGDVPRNIRIETGGGKIDPDLLDLHSNVGRQIEATGGLTDRLKKMLADVPEPPPGSKGWEAKLEIQKISAESEILRLRAESGSLTKAEIDAISHRQAELAAATETQYKRLRDFESQGEGWVASPGEGQQQAEALGWDKYKLPDKHHWFPTSSGEPVLRRSDGSVDKMKFNPDHGDGPAFIPDREPTLDYDAFMVEARKKYAGMEGKLPDSTLTQTQANQKISDYRKDRKPKITDRDGGKGTVAVTEVDGEIILGVNSTNHTALEKDLVDVWVERMGAGHKQALYHAEAHTLMQVYLKTGGNMPPKMTLHIDNPKLCGFCRNFLPDIAEEMGIDLLEIVLPSGHSVLIQDGLIIRK